MAPETREATAILEQPQIDAQEMAREIDAAALEQAAAQQERITAVGLFARQRLQELVESGAVPQDAVSQIQSALAEFQRMRMAAVRGDGSVVIANLQPGVAGQSDGRQQILDVQSIDRETYKHEHQHVLDGRGGLPSDLDQDLSPATGVAAIDERLRGFGTKRDVLEERAMDAAGEIPEPYRTTHWATVKDMEKRGQSAGVDMEAANDALIEQGSDEAYRRALVELSVREIGKDDPEELAKLEEAAQREGTDAVVLTVLAKVRDEYENGTRAARNAAARSELTTVA